MRLAAGAAVPAATEELRCVRLERPLLAVDIALRRDNVLVRLQEMLHVFVKDDAESLHDDELEVCHEFGAEHGHDVCRDDGRRPVVPCLAADEDLAASEAFGITDGHAAAIAALRAHGLRLDGLAPVDLQHVVVDPLDGVRKGAHQAHSAGSVDVFGDYAKGRAVLLHET